MIGEFYMSIIDLKKSFLAFEISFLGFNNLMGMSIPVRMAGPGL